MKSPPHAENTTTKHSNPTSSPYSTNEYSTSVFSSTSPINYADSSGHFSNHTWKNCASDVACETIKVPNNRAKAGFMNEVSSPLSADSPFATPVKRSGVERAFVPDPDG